MACPRATAASSARAGPKGLCPRRHHAPKSICSLPLLDSSEPGPLPSSLACQAGPSSQLPTSLAALPLRCAALSMAMLGGGGSAARGV